MMCRYRLYQWRAGMAPKFVDYANVVKEFHRLPLERYELTCEGERDGDGGWNTLDELYYYFHCANPEGFEGSPISGGNLVLLEADGEKTLWFFDAEGPKQLGIPSDWESMMDTPL